MLLLIFVARQFVPKSVAVLVELMVAMFPIHGHVQFKLHCDQRRKLSMVERHGALSLSFHLFFCFCFFFLFKFYLEQLNFSLNFFFASNKSNEQWTTTLFWRSVAKLVNTMPFLKWTRAFKSRIEYRKVENLLVWYFMVCIKVSNELDSMSFAIIKQCIWFLKYTSILNNKFNWKITISAVSSITNFLWMR